MHSNTWLGWGCSITCKAALTLFLTFSFTPFFLSLHVCAGDTDLEVFCYLCFYFPLFNFCPLFACCSSDSWQWLKHTMEPKCKEKPLYWWSTRRGHIYFSGVGVYTGSSCRPLGPLEIITGQFSHFELQAHLRHLTFTWQETFLKQRFGKSLFWRL